MSVTIVNGVKGSGKTSYLKKIAISKIGKGIYVATNLNLATDSKYYINLKEQKEWQKPCMSELEKLPYFAGTIDEIWGVVILDDLSVSDCNEFFKWSASQRPRGWDVMYSSQYLHLIPKHVIQSCIEYQVICAGRFWRNYIIWKKQTISKNFISIGFAKAIS